MKMLLYKNGDDTQKVFFFGDVPAPQTKLIAGKQYQKVDLSDDESGRLLGIERQRWYQQRPFEYIGPYVEPSPHNQPFMPCLLSDDDYKLICRWLPNVNPGHQPPRELHSLFLVQFQYPPEHCRQLTWAQIMEILRAKPLPEAGQAKPADALEFLGQQKEPTASVIVSRKPLSDLQDDVWKILEKHTTKYDKYGSPKKCLTGDEIADTLADNGCRNQTGKSIGDVISAMREKGWTIENQRGQGYFIPKSSEITRN